MAFELYQVRTRPLETEPGLSISPSGLFNINRKAVEQWFSGTAAVQLLFDAQSKQVAIKPAQHTDENTLKLRRPGRTPGVHISAQGFLNSIGVKVDKTQKFPLSWRDDIGAAVFSIKSE